MPPANGLRRRTLKKLVDLVSPTGVSTRFIDRLTTSRDAWIRNLIRLQGGELPPLPDAVVWPSSAGEVAALVKFAAREGLSIIPFGAGSGVCGGVEGGGGRIVVDLKRMKGIVEIDRERFEVEAQAGILGQHLETRLNEEGFTLGHFPSSILCSTLGGWIAGRSAGQFSSKYGKIEDMVTGLEWVMPSGEVVRLFRDDGSSSGWDTIPLWVGSEGTLGIVTKARLRIRPTLEARVFSSFEFKDLAMGIEAIRKIMQAGLFPIVVRLYDPLDSFIFKHGFEKGEPGELGLLIGKAVHRLAAYAGRRILEHAGWIERIIHPIPMGCVLILGFEGESRVANAKLKEALKLCRKEGAVEHGAPLGEYWEEHRYSISFKLARLLSEGYFADTMEVAARWSDLLNLYRLVRDALSKHVCVLAHFSHAYPEGCSIYFTFIGYRASFDEALKLYNEVWRAGLAACREAGGTISHHHGVGRLKVEAFQEEMGPAFEIIQRWKKRLDPHRLMNPGGLGL